MIAGYHGLHVLAGVGVLAGLALRGPGAGTLEVASLYWQFVDVAWIVIFTVIYLLPAVRVG